MVSGLPSANSGLYLSCKTILQSANHELQSFSNDTFSCFIYEPPELQRHTIELGGLKVGFGKEREYAESEGGTGYNLRKEYIFKVVAEIDRAHERVRMSFEAEEKMRSELYSLVAGDREAR
jgi:hypothetical protein